MAHSDQLTFFSLVKESMPQFFAGVNVLEVGSLDINGSVRSFFSDCSYLGIDVGPGQGVDLVASGESYDGADRSFDVVLSAECMEHNPAWAATTQNMVRMLRPGGLLIITCAAPGRPEHGTSRSHPTSSPLTVQLGQDYYRNLSLSDFHDAGVLRDLDTMVSWINWSARDLYIVGVKGSDAPPGWSEFLSHADPWIVSRQGSGAFRWVERSVLQRFGSQAVDRLLQSYAWRGVRRLCLVISGSLRPG